MAAKIVDTERAFLQHNEPYFEQARMGFLHGMPPSSLPEMERIYRAYLDPHFILTQWCSACVVDMMVRLSRWWEGVQAEEEAAALAMQAAQDRANAVTSADMEEIVWANLVDAASIDAASHHTLDIVHVSYDKSRETPSTPADVPTARPKDTRPKSRRGRPKKEA